MTTRSRLGGDLIVGSRVTVTGKKGVVKFMGTTQFAAGDWIGVELELEEGKNDGTVNGVQYFDGRSGHGLFVKKAQVRLDRSTASSSTSPSHGGKSGSQASFPCLTPSAGTPGKERTTSRLAAIREKNKALKESLAAGRNSPRMPRRTPGRTSTGLRSPTPDSVFGDPNDASSPTSVTSITSMPPMISPSSAAEESRRCKPCQVMSSCQSVANSF